ncbi:MAG TPA: nicotinate-nucleotide--dimethylbenzimidazole phosphoribosyltransferase, partial [Symbiobacteriaceae bacterium]
MTRLHRIAQQIPPLDEAAAERARRHLDSLTKPPGSLGRLEELAIRLAAMTGQMAPPVSPATVLVVAGDHGVTAEGVSAYPAEVTPQMVLNFLRGGAAINALARVSGARVRVVDAGMAVDLEHPDLTVCKVRRGTGNICREPAMTREETEAALCHGIELADEEAGRGTRVIALGEMGIGNTTPSAALLAFFSGRPPETVVGRGTGLDERGLQRKADAVRRALALHKPDPSDPVGVLAALGGLEIATLAGVVLGAAARRIPVVVDGFITTAAAIVAVRIAPAAVNYLIASHRSAEPGHALMLEMLGLRPLLELDLRLGEGTGAALALPLLEAAHRVMTEMATFE